MATSGSDGQRQWGVTAPISTSSPTPQELQLNQTLIDELRNQNNFEPTEDTEKRKRVLAHMQKVTEEFVRHVGETKGLAPSVIQDAGGKVSTFGSYRLGVYGPGSDIDTLIVAPKHVTREDFFDHFPQTLERMSSPGAIEEMKVVRDAHVPIIKLEYSGIDLDLIFTRLAIASVPESLDLREKSLLRGLDETDLRSINGTRVTDEILSLVPQVKPFRHALRAIKLWAQRRAIYANIVGFPGGVAWAMLVARICQLYPLACGATIVSKFFHLMKSWPWPRPVLLKNIEEGPLQVRVWNPQIYPADKRHLMPIITPAYPSMCATHNITHSTKAIILKELDRGVHIANNIVAGKATWKDLFVKHTFFTQDYKYYLSIVSAGRTKKAQKEWSGLVESKVRRLVSGIEMSDTGVECAHPFNKGFERIHSCKTEDEVDLIFQGDIQFEISEEKAAELEAIAEAEDSANGEVKPILIYTTTYYIGLELGETDVGKKLDITNPVAEFKRQCTESPLYIPELNSLRTVHTRSYDLPLDCFEAGEKRPEKTKGKKARNRAARNGAAASNGSTPIPAMQTESRKRGTEAEPQSTSSKKQNLDNVSDLTAGVKRALNQEGSEMSPAKRQSASVIAATPAG